MEISYWKSRWQKNKTGWHLEQVYPFLIQFWPALSLAEGATVLVPLCGKSQDVLWLADQGFHVIGVEASSKALKQLSKASGRSFSRDSRYGQTIFRSGNLELWKADFFSLPADSFLSVDAVYDKAAMVALPSDMRKKYTEKVIQTCTKSTQIFLQSFEYKQEEMHGPPFAVAEKEIYAHYSSHFDIHLLHQRSMLEDVDKFRRRGLHSYFIEKLYLLD